MLPYVDVQPEIVCVDPLRFDTAPCDIRASTEPVVLNLVADQPDDFGTQCISGLSLRALSSRMLDTL
ncbi:hypothetical protein I6G56_07770 [Burkholderia humptydooensis]|uniref:Uncharacterized protein n=1 Tax=Burkholderia humptydooensis TaxID=430531 RepID=A0A7T2U3I6_9BURK|nr:MULTISPECIES: hypothetical protein [Burkholderia]AJY41510.1 hypothetical protein BW21_2634 [Burkholderia sp. 2002721687]QPS44955.1 hypothetical protein I6G56_07770 [Burkholderia humptydooensis]